MITRKCFRAIALAQLLMLKCLGVIANTQGLTRKLGPKCICASVNATMFPWQYLRASSYAQILTRKCFSCNGLSAVVQFNVLKRKCLRTSAYAEAKAQVHSPKCSCGNVSAALYTGKCYSAGAYAHVFTSDCLRKCPCVQFFKRRSSRSCAHTYMQCT